MERLGCLSWGGDLRFSKSIFSISFQPSSCISAGVCRTRLQRLMLYGRKSRDKPSHATTAKLQGSAVPPQGSAVPPLYPLATPKPAPPRRKGTQPGRGPLGARGKPGRSRVPQASPGGEATRLSRKTRFDLLAKSFFADVFVLAGGGDILRDCLMRCRGGCKMPSVWFSRRFCSFQCSRGNRGPRQFQARKSPCSRVRWGRRTKTKDAKMRGTTQKGKLNIPSSSSSIDGWGQSE